MPEVCKVEKLKKIYKHEIVLDNISFSVDRGDMLGLIGGNGSGKTTLFRMITGVNKPDSGNITLFGGAADAGKYIGALIEKPYIIHGMTGMDNMRYYGRLAGENDEDMFMDRLKLMGLEDVAGKKAYAYSLGMRQRLGIAIALIGDVRLLVLDEPFNGLDAEGVQTLEHAIKELNETRDITIIMSSHTISELSKLCSRYIILEQGRISCQIEGDQVESMKKDPALLEKYIMDMVKDLEG